MLGELVILQLPHLRSSEELMELLAETPLQLLFHQKWQGTYNANFD